MAVETANYVLDLVTTSPAGTDEKDEGDNHIRLIKQVLATTFPTASRAFSLRGGAEKNFSIVNLSAGYAPQAADDGVLFLCNSSNAPFSITLPAIGNAINGRLYGFKKNNAGSNVITINAAAGEAIDGQTSYTLSVQNVAVWFIASGSDWVIAFTSNSSQGVPAHTHSANDIATTTARRFISDTQLAKLDGLLAGTSYYSQSQVDVLLSGKAEISDVGAADGICPLDSDSKVPTSYLPAAGITFKGTWDANSNTPSLSDGVGSSGDLYTVSVAGSTSLDGISTWAVGDQATFNGATWQRIPASASSVLTVFGRTGAVTANTGDYTADKITETTRVFTTSARNSKVDGIAAGAQVNPSNMTDGDVTTGTSSTAKTPSAAQLKLAVVTHGIIQDAASAVEIDKVSIMSEAAYLALAQADRPKRSIIFTYAQAVPAFKVQRPIVALAPGGTTNTALTDTGDVADAPILFAHAKPWNLGKAEGDMSAPYATNKETSIAISAYTTTNLGAGPGVGTDAINKLILPNIVEYIGVAGGKHEIKFRGLTTVQITSGNTTGTATMATSPTNIHRCLATVIAASGAPQARQSARAWLSGTNTVNVSASTGDSTSTYVVAVWEFTGTSWSVYHGLRTGISADASTEGVDEINLMSQQNGAGSASAVGDWGHAIIFHQSRGDDAAVNFQPSSVCWGFEPGSTTGTVAYQRNTAGTSTTAELAVTVVENADMQVLRGSLTTSIQGWNNVDISLANLNAVNESLFLGSATTGQGGYTMPNGNVGFDISSIANGRVFNPRPNATTVFWQAVALPRELA